MAGFLAAEAAALAAVAVLASSLVAPLGFLARLYKSLLFCEGVLCEVYGVYDKRVIVAL